MQYWCEYNWSTFFQSKLNERIEVLQLFRWYKVLEWYDKCPHTHTRAHSRTRTHCIKSLRQRTEFNFVKATNVACKSLSQCFCVQKAIWCAPIDVDTSEIWKRTFRVLSGYYVFENFILIIAIIIICCWILFSSAAFFFICVALSQLNKGRKPIQVKFKEREKKMCSNNSLFFLLYFFNICNWTPNTKQYYPSSYILCICIK